MESLYYRVSLVAVPQTPEQAVTAQRIVDLGLGRALAKEAVTVATLREAVEQVATERAIHERVEQMQHLTREAGGYLRATEAILRFTRQCDKA